MSGNRFGTLFQYQTFGESHGPAIGAIVDGVPPRIPLDEAYIQTFLDKRKPGQSRFTTQRQEPDAVKILSGVFEGQTTGTPIMLMIENTDQKSKDYGDIKDKFRPGHADFTYFKKYGIRDYRGGGRSSARETASRVAAGAVARKLLESELAHHSLKSAEIKKPAATQSMSQSFPQPGEPLPAVTSVVNPYNSGYKSEIKDPKDYLIHEFSEGIHLSKSRAPNGSHNVPLIRSAVVQIGEKKCDYRRWNWGAVDENPFFAADPGIVAEWEDYLDSIRKQGSSAGAIIECHASGFPPGLGAPVYDKLDADLAKAMMSINAVKAVEIGAGFESVKLGGAQNADEIRMDDNGNPVFLSNNAGGILGGISTGQDIVVRVAFKPTSSILTPVQTIDMAGNETDIITKGRHDPCVGIRGAPVVEAMMACVLADHWLRYKAQCL